MKIGTMKSAAAMLPIVMATLSLPACGGASSGGQPNGVATPTPSGSTPTPSGSTPTPSGGTGNGYEALAPSPSSSISYAIGGYTGFGYNGDPATGQIVPGSPISGDSPRVAFKYDHATQTYTLVTIDRVTQQERHVLFSTPVSATDPNYTDAKFLGYSGSAFGDDTTGILRLYRSGSANPEFRLTYSGFGHLARSAPIRHLNFGDSWFGYGVETRDRDIPASGTASYSGVLHGFAVDEVAGEEYTVEGTSSLVLNFADQRASGTVNMTLSTDDGSIITVGEATFSDAVMGSIEGTPSPFGTTLSGPTVPNGSIEARRFGPSVQEISGIFNASVAVGSASGEIVVHGAFAAIKN